MENGIGKLNGSWHITEGINEYGDYVAILYISGNVASIVDTISSKILYVSSEWDSSQNSIDRLNWFLHKFGNKNVARKTESEKLEYFIEKGLL